MRKYRLGLLVGIAWYAAFGSGCTKSTQTSVSDSDKQKMTETSRQAEIDVKSYQIDHSNLPPEQKQRMLEQIRAGSGK